MSVPPEHPTSTVRWVGRGPCQTSTYLMDRPAGRQGSTAEQRGQRAAMPRDPTIRSRRAVVGGIMMLLTSGCVPGSSLPTLENYAGATYQLGVGDQVRVLTFGVESLTGTFRVNDTGDIDLPLLGSFRAAGRSTQELRKALAAELETRRLLRDPNLSIEVVEYRPIFVLGEVSRPGQFPYQPGMKMLTAVAVAGGFTYRAVQDHVQALRSTNATPITGRAPLDAFVAPGDVITVLERWF